MNKRSPLLFLLALFGFGYCFGYIISYIMDAVAELDTRVSVHDEVLNKVTYDLYLKKQPDTDKPLVEPCEGCE